MPGVHRDKRTRKKNATYYCHFCRADGSRACRSTGTTIRSEAKAICAAWQQAEDEAGRDELFTERVTQILNETLSRIGAAIVKRPLLQTWLGDWLAVKKHKLKPWGYKGSLFVIREFLAFLPNADRLRLDQVTEADIRRFAAHLGNEGRTASTVNRLIHGQLNGAFARAVKVGQLRVNPIALVERQKETKVRRSTFAPEQVVQLVKVTKGTDWEGCILLGYGSGMRLSDAANLRWSNVDLVVGVISFQQRKTLAETIIGLHSDFAGWLSTRSASDLVDAPIFPSLAGRSSGGYNGLSPEFGDLIRKAGIQNYELRKKSGTRSVSVWALSYHSFRHGAASAVFNNAVVRETARRVTGHSSQALSRYLHVDLRAIQSAIQLIPRLPQ